MVQFGSPPLVLPSTLQTDIDSIEDGSWHEVSDDTGRPDIQIVDANRSIRVNGADCGVESILLGVVTSVGGFLFGYDTGQISGMLIFTDFRNRFATGEPAGPGEPRQFVSPGSRQGSAEEIY